MTLRMAAAAAVIGAICLACAVPLYRINGESATFKIRLDVSPSNAKVYLDGYYVGKAKKFDGDSRSLNVAKGAHVLTFTAKKFENETVEVQGKSEMQTIKLVMKPVPK